MKIENKIESGFYLLVVAILLFVLVLGDGLKEGISSFLFLIGLAAFFMAFLSTLNSVFLKKALFSNWLTACVFLVTVAFFGVHWFYDKKTLLLASGGGLLASVIVFSVLVFANFFNQR